MLRPSRGFTIVELLIVVVVIGILAAITIVAYNGIQERARVSSVSSALSQAAKKIAVWQVDNPSTSPGTLAAAGVTDSGDVSYQYTSGSNGTYCITATVGSTSYKITESSSGPSAGGCSGHGQGGIAVVTNLATNPSFETNLTTHYGARGAISLDGTKAYSESSSVKYVADGITGANYLSSSVPTGNISNQTVTASIQAQRSTTAASMLVRIYFRDASNAIIGAGIDGSSVTLNSGDWVQAGVTATAPAGTTNIVIYSIFSPGSFTSGITFWFDGFMVKLGNPVGYADGSSTNWVWNGVAHASTSTGPPL